MQSMLLYSNRGFVRIAFERRGSIILQTRNVIIGCALAGVCIGLQHLINVRSPYAPRIPNNYGMSAMGVVVAFATVFRTNQAWQRYWEGLTQVQSMYSKWEDTFAQISVFISTSIVTAKGKQNIDRIRRLRRLYAKLYRHFSLLSAMAADRLAKGDVQRMDRRREVAPWSDQVILRRHLKSLDTICDVASLPGLHTATDAQDLEPKWDMAYSVTSLPTAMELEALLQTRDRPTLVMTWIIDSMAQVSSDLDISPPIQSRMYQELSTGMLAFF